MSVDKKAAMKRIAELTKSESWQEDKTFLLSICCHWLFHTYYREAS